jgi:hypothetical protein
MGAPPPPAKGVRSVSRRLPKYRFPHRLHSYASSLAVSSLTHLWLLVRRQMRLFTQPTARRLGSLVKRRVTETLHLREYDSLEAHSIRRYNGTRREATTRMGLRCIFGHKWGVAQRTEGGAQTLECRRCGKTRALAGSTPAARREEETAKTPDNTGGSYI